MGRVSRGHIRKDELSRFNASEPLAREHHERAAQMMSEGASQAAISRELGVNRSTVREWCSGETPASTMVLSRARWLRNRSAVRVLRSSDEVLTKMVETVDEARAGGQYKAAIDGLKWLHERIREAEQAGHINTYGEPMHDDDLDGALALLGGSDGPEGSEDALQEVSEEAEPAGDDLSGL